MDLETLQDTPPWEWPEDTAEMLLGVLNDGAAADSGRILAASLAGDLAVIDDKIASALLTIVSDGDASEDLRSTAVIALGPALEQTEMFGFDDPDDLVVSEPRFREIQRTLRRLYLDANVPGEVRRRILEASVRAPQDWHRDAVRAAYASTDQSWVMTAVFCMRFLRGFNDQILAALNNNNPDIRYEAVCAAGNWAIESAWEHIAAILFKDAVDKPLLIAAIEAAAAIRPQEALDRLYDLRDSEDDDIAEAAEEALAMAEGLAELEDDDDEDDEPLR